MTDWEASVCVNVRVCVRKQRKRKPVCVCVKKQRKRKPEEEKTSD